MAQRITLLVTVKAYPAVSKKHGEVVCVAGIRTDVDPPQWVRLYPVPFRDLEYSQRFRKYQFISLDATPHTGDHRPESMRPNLDTLQVGEHIDTRGPGWRHRLDWVEPLLVESMCGLAARERESRQSLGAFRPHEVIDVVAEPAEPWSEEKAARAAEAAQPTLFMPKGRKELEQLPYRFSYRYRCADPECNGHKQSIIDWELGEAWRSWWQFGEEERVERVRDKWLNQLCGTARDPIFFAGNQHRYPQGFLVLGVLWPPKEVTGQPSLF